MENLICTYDDYDFINEDWDIANDDYQYVSEEADIILSKKDYVKVEGINQRWNGSRGIDSIITETNLKDIVSKYINPDEIRVEVYADRVEFENHHHDGTNCYTFTPFSFNDLTKKELLELVDKEDYEWYGNKLYKATKDDLIFFLEDNI